MKAIGYIRVSTQEQAKEGLSLENQIHRIKTYSEYKGLELVKILEDAGVSGGKNKKRSGFMLLLDEIEKEKIDAVIIYSLSRLSRDMLTLLCIEKYLNENNVKLHTIEGQIDTSEPQGFMNFAMNSFMGEMERRQIQYRTKKALDLKKQKNECLGPVPYGYYRQDKKLVKNPEEQEIIKLINYLYENKYKLSKIRDYLKEKGIHTRTGKHFDSSQVKRHIRNYKTVYNTDTKKLSDIIKNFIIEIS